MTARRRIAVIGAGGCAREVAWTLRDIARHGGDFEFAGYVVSEGSAFGATDHLSQPRLDLDALGNSGRPDGFVLGVGSPPLRAKLRDEFATRFPEAVWPVLVHPSVLGDLTSATLKEGVVVCAGTILTVNVRIEAHSLVHYGSLLSHETSIGRFCNVNPGCRIAGNVTIEDEVAVGIGAQIIQNVRVGSRAVIGAGAVVIRDVQAGTTVAGVPAKRLR